jgi:hypothetical protein
MNIYARAELDVTRERAEIRHIEQEVKSKKKLRNRPVA